MSARDHTVPERQPDDLPDGADRWTEVVRADEAPDTLPDAGIDPDDDATIFYTSGTTGRPKGIRRALSGLAIDDPNLVLGSDTAGTFATAFDGDLFESNWNLQAVHYVASAVQIGSSGFQLQPGDILLSPRDNVTFTSTNLVALDTANGFGATLTAAKEDLVLFRPDNSGDLGRGQFAMLLQDVTGGHELRGVTLVEQTTTVGDVTLQAGDLLDARAGRAGDREVVDP